MTQADPFAGLPFTVPAQYRGNIIMSAARWNIDPRIVASQLWAESRFKPDVRSSKGAEGIAQFEPDTAASLGVDPWNPSSAIDGLAHLDSNYVQQFGSIDLALAAYNAGPQAVIDAGNQIPPFQETQSYVSSILADAGTGGGGSTGIPEIPIGSIGGGSGGSNGGILSNLGRYGKILAGVGIAGAGIYFVMSKQPGSFKPLRELVNSP